eukprot:TRINITY_DN564_c0_g1_i1.p1 TRINITY_DN564_c0_g1~~TRINITY_DN564_c0_g1_i1.p1  ORF type:complete len:1379 (-),score=445.40 TRINITY_DN564_c0_g1_i1:244-4380(-)
MASTGQNSDAGGKGKKAVRIFLSSTFRDMQEERFRLATNTFQQLRYKCESKGIDFSVVDLRWGITEEESRGGQVLRRCFDEIDRSNYFVCLLGERYGWSATGGAPDALLQSTFENAIRDGHKWLGRYRDRSITELEVLYGALELQHGKNAPAAGASRSVLLSSQEESPRALAFLRNELYATKRFAIGDEQRKDFEPESDAHYRRLELLKDRIRGSPALISSHDYEDPVDLTAKCLRELWALLVRDYPELEEGDEDESKPLSGVATPLELHTQALEQCRAQAKVFVGRAKIMRALAEACKKSGGKVRNNVIAVAGESGSGLSSLLSAFCLQSTSAYDVLPIFAGTRVETRTAGSLLRQVESILKEMYDIALPVPEDGEGARQHFAAWLEATHARLRLGGKKLLLVLDGLDKLEACDDYNLRWLPEVIPPSIRIIVSSNARAHATPGTQGDPSGANEDHPVVRALEERSAHILELELLSEPERRRLAETYLAQFGKKMSQQQLVAFSKHPCCGMPRFAQVVLHQLTCYASFETLFDQMQRYLAAKDFASLYEVVLGDWESAYDHGKEKNLVSRTLSSLFVLQGGLSEIELMTAVKVKHVTLWTPFFQVLRGSLTKLPSGCGVYALFNRHLRSAAEKRYLSTAQRVRAARLSMVSFFESRPLTCESTLDELAPLLVSVIRSSSRSTVAGSVSRLVNFLSDLDVLMLMYEGGRKQELFTAWGEVRVAQGPDAVEVYDRVTSRGGKACGRTALVALAGFYGEIGEFRAAVAIANRLVSSDRAKYGREAVELGESHLLGAEHALKAGDGELAVKFASAAQMVFEKAQKREERDTHMMQKMAQFSFLSGSGDARDSSALLGLIRAVSLVAEERKKRGEYEQARTFYATALSAAAALREDSPHLARLHSLAADVSRKLGHYDEAERSYLKAVRILAKAYGEYHPHVVEVQRNIALVHKKKGNYNEAKRHYATILDTLSSVFGRKHFSYGVMLNEYADVIRKMSNPKDAEPLYREALAVIEGSLGPEHPEMVDPLMSLGRLLKKEGAYPEARTHYERAIEIVEEVYGVDHYKYPILLTAIGDVERKCGNYDRAQVMYADALGALESSVGCDHIELSDVLNSLGLVHKKLAQYSAARAFYDRALSIVKLHLGEGHLKYGVLMTNVGDVIRKEGRSEEALRVLEQAKDTLEGVVGKQHTEVAEVLHSIGKVYAQMGQQSTSTRYFLDAIRMVQECLGRAHPKVGFYTNSLGEALQLTSPDEALKKYKAAQSLLEQALGKQHPEVADVWTNIGHCQAQLRNKAAAAAAYNEAIGIVYKVFGMEHPKFEMLCKNIAKVGGTVSVGVETSNRMRQRRTQPRKVVRGRRGAGQHDSQEALRHAVTAMQLMGWV